jgi:ABC-2 type transport system permease protein
MMAVIVNSYGNVSSSLFSTRFQKNIEEMLVSPMHYSLLLLGYVVGGVLRGVIVALLVFIITSFFLTITFDHLPLTILVVILVAAVFSLAGFTNAMLARNFDDIMLIPTFVLTPLTYLGGVFYSVEMLPDFWQKVALFNPVVYLISGFRWSFYNAGDVSLGLSVAMTLGFLSICVAVIAWIFKTGYKLKN